MTKLQHADRIPKPNVGGERAAIPSFNERGPETTSREEFQHSLQLLDEIVSQHLWGGALLVLLLPGVIVLLPFLLEQLNLVRVLLGMIWAASALTLYRNRR